MAGRPKYKFEVERLSVTLRTDQIEYLRRTQPNISEWLREAVDDKMAAEAGASDVSSIMFKMQRLERQLLELYEKRRSLVSETDVEDVIQGFGDKLTIMEGDNAFYIFKTNQRIPGLNKERVMVFCSSHDVEKWFERNMWDIEGESLSAFKAAIRTYAEMDRNIVTRLESEIEEIEVEINRLRERI